MLAVEARIHSSDGRGIARIKSLLHETTGEVENSVCVLTGFIDTGHVEELERVSGVRVRYLLS
jgi:hypothetical protein